MISSRNKITYFILRTVWSMTGTEKLRKKIRPFLLKYRPVLPRELSVNRGDTVVQVGIPSRNSLYRLIKAIASDGRLLVIEPDLRNQKMVSDVVQSLKAEANVQLIKKAAWDKSEKITFLSSKRLGDGRVSDSQIVHDNDLREQSESGGYEKVSLDGETLENILSDSKVNCINFIEIAVNGAEFRALQGMGKYVQLTERFYIKAHARDATTDKPILHNIMSYLTGEGFSVCKTKETKSVHADWGNRQGDVYAWRD